MDKYHPEDVIPLAVTLIVTLVLVLLASSSLGAATLAQQCTPMQYLAVAVMVDGILAREGSAYRVDTAQGGSFLQQDARLTRVQLRRLLTTHIDPCLAHTGPDEAWRWQVLHDRVTAEIGRRDLVSAL